MIPRITALNSNSAVLSKRRQQQLWELFLRNGSSSHSGAAATLWYVLDRCEREGVPYQLAAVPGEYYIISTPPKRKRAK